MGLWAVVGLACLWIGGIPEKARAVLHLGVAATAVLAAAQPADVLARAGKAWRWLLACLFPLAAVAIGLLPVPRALLALVAPGAVAVWPATSSWATLGTSPEATIGELCGWLMVTAFGVGVAVFGTGWRRRSIVTTVLVATSAALVFVALLHALTGTKAVFGILPIQAELPVFFAPFVDTNHLAALLLLALPTVVGEMLERSLFADATSAVSWLTVVTIAPLLVWMDTMAAQILFAVILFGMSARFGAEQVYVRRGLAVAAVAYLARALFFTDWIEHSVLPRLVLWRDTARMLPSFWLAGTGAGAFASIFPAYRSDHVWLSFAHAHDDWLEWVAETGLVGLVLGVAGLALLRLPRAEGDRERRRGTRLLLGLLALAAAAAVEFPLHMPAIALAGAGVLAARIAMYGGDLATSALGVRALALGLAAIQVPCAAWMYRGSVASAAVATIHTYAQDPSAAVSAGVRLAWAAPWRPEATLLRAWEAERGGDAPTAVAAALDVEARFPGDADALRQAGLVLARQGRGDDALRALHRAAERGPQDERNWVAIAKTASAFDHTDEALDGWRHAVLTGGHFADLRTAYKEFPIGVYWLDAVSGADAGYSFYLAQILVEADDPDTALLAYEQAAALDPEKFGDSPNRARALLLLGRNADAEACVRRSLAAHPDDAAAQQMWAEVLAHEGRWSEAEDAYLVAAKQTPWLRVEAVRAASQANGPEAGLELIRRFSLEGVTDDGALALEAGRLRKALGDPAGCIREVEDAKVGRQQRYAAEAQQLVADCSALVH